MREQLRGVDFALAADELRSRFSGAILARDLAGLLDAFLATPGVDAAAKLVMRYPEFHVLFEECRPGGVISLQRRVREGRDPPSVQVRDPQSESSLLDSDVDGLVVGIAKGDVLAGNIKPTLDVLNTVLANRQSVVKFRDAMSIFVSGYDSDPRELHEIPEVRRFFVALDRAFPYWFYFLPKRGPLLTVVALCIMKDSSPRDSLQVTQEQLSDFVLAHFAAVNDLFSEYDLPEHDNERLSSEVATYFSG